MKYAAFLMLGLMIASPLDAADESSDSEPSAAKSTSFWMEKKLEYSSAILKGLATVDYGSVQQNAEKMRLLSKVEGFVRSRNPEYRVQLRLFERISREIGRQAEQENLEGMTLAFNQLTVSCVSCHKLLRDNSGN